MSLFVRVFGIPAPQGSKKFVGLTKAGRGMLVESSKKVKPWRIEVRRAAELAIFHARALGLEFPIPGPIKLRVIFTLPKPVSAPKTRRTYPSKMPDLSKLLRSTEDALTDAGVWEDDARVIEVSRLAKVYPGEDPEALSYPGAIITIERAHPGD